MSWLATQAPEVREALEKWLDGPIGVEAKRYAGDDRAFGCWLLRIDSWFRHYFGVSVFDLEDQPFADWHEDGLTPREAVRAIREATV